MYIFVDKNLSPNIVQFDKIVRSFDDFKVIVNNTPINFMSINYEVDENTKSTDVIKYLKTHNIHIPFINIHTTNSVARSNTRAMIKRYLPNTIITFIKNI